MDNSSNINSSSVALRQNQAGVVSHGVTTRPESLNGMPDALGLLKALRRRWVLASASGLALATVAGPLAWFVVPRDKYTATATLEVATKPKRIIFEPREGIADFSTYQKTQAALFKDPSVISHAITKLTTEKGLGFIPTLQEHPDPEGWLATQLKVEFVGGSEVLKVSLSGDRPRDLANIVNQMVDSYMIEVVEAEKKARTIRLETLEALSDRYKKELEDKRKAYQSLAGNLGANDQTAIALAQQSKVENIGLTQRELLKLRSDVLKVEAEIKARKSNHLPAALTRSTTMPDTAASSGMEINTNDPRVDQDPRVIAVRTRISELIRSRGEIARLVKDRLDPTVTSVTRKLDAATRELHAVRSEVQAQIAAQDALSRRPPIGHHVEPEASDVEDLVGRVGILKAQEKGLQDEVDRLQGDLKQTSRGGLDLESERQALDVLLATAVKVQSEVEAMRVELRAPDRITKRSPARPPQIRDELKKIKAGGVASLGAFTLALFGVSLWEFSSRRVNSTSDLVNGLGIRIVGSLPVLPKPTGRNGKSASLSVRRRQGLLIESVDATRTMLLHASRADSVRVVMVTSAVKGEGKTSIACHLAASLARAGRKTLLIDCDMRCPAAHHLLDVTPQPGVCEYLRGDCTLEDATKMTVAPGLDVIPAGNHDTMALQAIAQEGLRDLFNEMRSRYDFIIVDSAPVLAVADSQLICQQVDGVILAVLRDVSRLPQVYATYERITGLGAKIIGAVVGGVRGESYDNNPYYSAAATETRGNKAF